MINARIYIRCPNDEHGTLSIEAQERQCHMWCELHDYTVQDVYIDDNASGLCDDRPNFRRLVHDATNDPGSTVVVHTIDRLTRKAHTMLQIMRAFESHNITVNSVHEKIERATPHERMAITSLASFAEFYSHNLSIEIAKGLREKSERGGVVGSVSFGYMRAFVYDVYGKRVRGTEHVVPSPDAPTVVNIFTRYVTKSYSDLTLAKALNVEGFTFCHRGRLQERTTFTADTVGGILTNRIYIGAVTYKGATRQGKHPALVDDDLFEHVQALRQRRKTRCKEM